MIDPILTTQQLNNIFQNTLTYKGKDDYFKYRPNYKQGDVVTDSDGDMFMAAEDAYGEICWYKITENNEFIECR